MRPTPAISALPQASVLRVVPSMSVLLSCLLGVASSHPVVLRTRLGRGLCRSATLRAVSCCAQQQHTSLAERRCTPEPPAVLALREETERLMPSGAHMMSGAQQGRLLQMLVRLSRAQRVLELGCFTGYAWPSPSPSPSP